MQTSLHGNIINMHVNADIITQILLLQYVPLCAADVVYRNHYCDTHLYVNSRHHIMDTWLLYHLHTCVTGDITAWIYLII